MPLSSLILLNGFPLNKGKSKLIPTFYKILHFLASENLCLISAFSEHAPDSWPFHLLGICVVLSAQLLFCLLSLFTQHFLHLSGCSLKMTFSRRPFLITPSKVSRSFSCTFYHSTLSSWSLFVIIYWFVYCVCPPPECKLHKMQRLYLSSSPLISQHLAHAGNIVAAK